MAANFPECPPTLKPILHYLKAAQEHDARDVVVAYWCRLYALQVGLKIKTNTDPNETKLLIAVMDWLETRKHELADNESVTNDVAAQAYLENYALKLFMFADKQDRESNFGKNVVKAFYTAGLIYDVLQTFGELTEEVFQNRKYAKWKAAYINNCLKNGETPIPGPMHEEGDEPSESSNAGPPPSQPSFGFQDPGTSFEPPQPPSDFPSDLPSLNDVAKSLPSPPSEPEKSPGGFQAYVPATGGESMYQLPAQPTGDVHITAEQIVKAQKYCKWAASALTYDDVRTAIENLQKGLTLLTTGQDS